MKRRTQRIFISLLAFFIAGFAIVNAYTFEVVNWSPFGVLNLQKLILKGGTTSTGIILDGKEYVIKIDPEHENNGGQIRVYEICDENGQNCREVSSLYTGSQGAPGPQGATGAAGATGADGIGIQNISSSKNGKITTVTITYTNGGTASFQISDGADGTNGNGSEYTLPEATSTGLGGVKLGSDNIQSVPAQDTQAITGRTYRIQKNSNGQLVVNVPWENDNDYTVVGGGEDFICTKSGLDLDCVKAKLGTMQDQKICYYNSGTQSISCSQNQPGNRTINFKNASGAILYTFSLNDSGSALDIIRPSGVGGLGEPGPQGATGENGVSVVNAYTEGDNIVFKLSNNDTIVLPDVLIRLKGDKGDKGDTGDATDIPGENGQRCKYVCQKVNGETECGAQCYQDDPSGTIIKVDDVQKNTFNINGTENYDNMYCKLTSNNSMQCDNELWDILRNKLQGLQNITVNDAAVTITQGGIQKGRFTLNQSNDLTIDLDAGGSGTSSGTGSDIWKAVQSGTNYTLRPLSSTYNVNIGETTYTNYKLRVNGDTNIETKLVLGHQGRFVIDGTRKARNVFNFKTYSSTQKYSPTITYTEDLVIRPRDATPAYNRNNYTTFGYSGNVGVGGEPDSGNIKLSVYGRERIYSESSGSAQYIDLYNDGYESYIISKRGNMTLGLTGNSEIVGQTQPNAYIKINKNTIGLNMNPVVSTWNPSIQQGYIRATLQVNGGIQIKNTIPVSNEQSPAGTQNKMLCGVALEGTIQYYEGNFYGCVKVERNNQYYYRWRKFDTSSFADMNTTVPSLPAQM